MGMFRKQVGWKFGIILLSLIGIIVGLDSSPGLASMNVDEVKFIELELIASGFNMATDLVQAPDGRLFVSERGGLIRIIDTNGAILATPFIDLSSKVGIYGEEGLTGLALHPDFANNGRFFVGYTTHDPIKSVVSSFLVSGGNINVADPASEQVIIAVNEPTSIHNGGDVAFGPVDGYLYAGFGDGGPGNDPSNRGQDGGTWLGKILRLDVDGDLPYEVPVDNPFVADPQVLDEIWAMGLRNPWRFTFDRLTGDLYIADVGQQSWEEVDFEPAGSGGGVNYGWRCYEAFHPFNLSSCGPEELYEKPVFEYASVNEDCAIVGGYVYRGLVSLPIDGTYIFADYCSGRLWGIEQVADEWVVSATGKSPGGAVTSFGEGVDGSLYLVDAGHVYKVTARSVAVSAKAFLPAIFR